MAVEAEAAAAAVEAEVAATVEAEAAATVEAEAADMSAERMAGTVDLATTTGLAGVE